MFPFLFLFAVAYSVEEESSGGMYLESVSGDLKDHIIKLPRGQGFVCSMCEYKAPYYAHVDRHYQAKHQTSCHLFCRFCGKGFRTATSRQQHIKKVHGMNLKAKEIEEL